MLIAKTRAERHIESVEHCILVHGLEVENIQIPLHKLRGEMELEAWEMHVAEVAAAKVRQAEVWKIVLGLGDAESKCTVLDLCTYSDTILQNGET